MNNPLVTVITICYNAEKEIALTMNSVLSQTYSDMEYIIIDGNSKDNTLLIAKELASSFPERNVHIYSEPDKGIYDAMNKGLRLAKGEWISMMNAGDEFTDAAVLSKVFNRHLPDNISFVYSDAWLEDGNKRRLHITSIKEGVVLHQASIYRKSLHDRFGLYIVTHPIIISDYLFFCHIPEQEYLKIDDVIIAVFKLGGISSERWCFNQKLCADVIFNKITMGHAIIKYLFNPIIVLFPEALRNFVKHTFFKK